MPDFSHFLDFLEPWIAAYGAPVVFVVLTLESFGAPLPGESLLVFAAIMASRGKLSFPAVLLAAWAGAVVGDNIGYLIGRGLGRGLVERYGAKIGLTPQRFAKVEVVFRKYGVLTVAFARFFNVLRQLNGIVAGTLEMPRLKFLACNAAGGALWVGVWGFGGYYFGTHGSDIVAMARDSGWAGAMAGIALVAGGALYFFLRRRRDGKAR